MWTICSNEIIQLLAVENILKCVKVGEETTDLGLKPGVKFLSFHFSLEFSNFHAYRGRRSLLFCCNSLKLTPFVFQRMTRLPQYVFDLTHESIINPPIRLGPPNKSPPPDLGMGFYQPHSGAAKHMLLLGQSFSHHIRSILIAMESMDLRKL